MALKTHRLCSPWPVDLECCPEAKKADPEQLRRWTLVASTLLWRASGMRWGPSCPITVRPCRRSCLDQGPVSFQANGASTGGWTPYIDGGGTWRNRGACGCTTDCSCTELCEVYLPGPVYDVVSVDIDGEVLTRPDPKAGVIGDYRVDAPGMLVRTDGGCWPDCQPMDAPCGAPGTFCVTYRTGLTLDAFAIAAVSEVLCHLLKGCKGKGGGECGCNIPANARRVSRQGVELDRGDPAELQAGGLLGLPIADAWIRAVNPDGLHSASRVYSPDFRRPRVTAWP